MNDRIKLAEAMGWYRITDPDEFVKQWKIPATHFSDGAWVSPDHRNLTAELPFDPENDANDCNALIKHLNGLEWHVEIIHYASDHAEVSIEQHPDGLPVDWEGDNWMHGVCELALKVIA